MHTVTVERVRADKLAKQVYDFRYDSTTHELVLEGYKYMERLSKHKRYYPIQEWRRDLVGMFSGGIDFGSIPLDPQITDAARTMFLNTLEVVKQPTLNKLKKKRKVNDDDD